MDLNLIRRLKILLKYQGENIKSGVSRIGNYTGLFILYPFILWSFFTTMNTSELSLNLSKSIFYIGLIVWGDALLLTVIDCLKKNQFLVGLSTCLMYIYGIFTLPISSTAAWGDGRLNFVALQEVSIILWPMIYYIILAYFMIDKKGRVLKNDKEKLIFAYIMIFPIALAVVVAVPMIYFISEYYYIYLAWGLEVTFSVYLVAIWQYVFYPLRHKSDLAVASEVQSQTVDALSDTLQEQHFDKDEFKED
ncbi:hypothetical protein [Streptococcus equinus]|uniref:hypothetical protein n=1 Tax=Streptococcus equinus TaxID=1335 RepID=UPI0008E64508|nr:hypothetical protein [Streptococcus equinus]SFC27709.1 hypothetical protein SAMN05216408_1412 [Streptococcus equinus]